MFVADSCEVLSFAVYLSLSEELGQGSELRRLRVGGHALQGLKVRLISTEAGEDGAGLLTRFVRAVELVGGGKGCSGKSVLVDQMELLYGVGANQVLLVFSRSDCTQTQGERSETQLQCLEQIEK